MTVRTHARIALVTAATVALTACAADDPNKRAKRGAAIGALVGAVAGHQVDGDKGRYVGAVVGALAGGAVGNYMDKQAAELERQLAAEAARDELQITRIANDALKIGIASDVSFPFDSADVKPGAQATYSKIANVLKDYDKTIVHIVGHTDTSGSASYNQGLSERRAQSVSSLMSNYGLNTARTLTEGRGEREPLVRTGDGVNEAANRRVDIVIKPVVEGQEQQAYAPPPYLGS
ncbi:OmpA family protein [bacterium]|nr:OmpA family protein [bacterium]